MVIAVVNQKGGTGKTTTTVNVGSAMADNGNKVLLVDIDPQSNLTYSLGINKIDYDVQDVLTNNISIRDAIVTTKSIDVLPTSIGLAKLELSQVDISNTAYHLRTALAEVEEEYDYILIDCPPSLSWLTINGLVAAQQVLIPMQLDVFSIQGLEQIMDSVKEMKTEYNDDLEILGVLAVLVDKRKKLTSEVIDYVRNNFDVHLFDSFIRTNVKAAEAPSFGMSVIDYAPNSNSARDYVIASAEILERIKENQISY